MKISAKEILMLRLQAQQLLQARSSVEELVSHMGALQAQDFAMSKWAIGMRVASAVEATIEEAISKGSIIRTHVLRPTWHIINAADAAWMLELTAPQVLRLSKSRLKELNLTEEVLETCRNILSEVLAGKSLSREKLNEQLEERGLTTGGQRSVHITAFLELNRFLCSGSLLGKQHTYALFQERIPDQPAKSEEEMLGEMALRYFTSHGPATTADFSWWSGLSITKARKAIELVSDHLENAAFNDTPLWFGRNLNFDLCDNEVHLLPAFDEFIISYKDRSAVLPQAHASQVLSKNGIFWPVVLIEGLAAGIWAREIKKDKVLVKINGFKRFTAKQRKAIEKAAAKFGAFLNLKAETLFS